MKTKAKKKAQTKAKAASKKKVTKVSKKLKTKAKKKAQTKAKAASKKKVTKVSKKSKTKVKKKAQTKAKTASKKKVTKVSKKSKTKVKKKAQTKVKTASKKTITKVSKKETPLKVYKPLVSIGKPVPSFNLPSTGGHEVSLNSLQDKKVVIFFYPKDATPGCTIEGHDFTRLKSDFEDKNTSVYGVSRDSIKSHERFKEKESYSIDLLSDQEEKLCQIFGVIKLKNMYGKQVRGIERSTFLINEKGELIKEWRGVKVPGHAEEVLSFVKEI